MMVPSKNITERVCMYCLAGIYPTHVPSLLLVTLNPLLFFRLGSKSIILRKRSTENITTDVLMYMLP